MVVVVKSSNEIMLCEYSNFGWGNKKKGQKQRQIEWLNNLEYVGVVNYISVVIWER